MTVVRLAGGLHHVAMRTDRFDECVRFYTDVLGLTERARHHEADGGLRSVWLGCEVVMLMIERRAPGEPGIAPGSMELVAWRIEPSQKDRWRTRLASHGVAVEAETASTLYIRDPDGRRIGLSGYGFG